MTSLNLRRRPTQERAARTFDQILETAAHLLEEYGWDGFTTNLLAEKANVNIQTLYRYFPNKLAVVATMSGRMIEDWNVWLEDADRLIEEKDFAGSFNSFINGIKNQPGGVAIMRALNASPTLKEMGQKDLDQLTERFAMALTRKSPHLTLKDARTIYRVIFASAIAVIDASLDMPKAEAERTIAASVHMLSLYLSDVMTNPQ